MVLADMTGGADVSLHLWTSAVQSFLGCARGVHLLRLVHSSNLHAHAQAAKMHL